MADANEKFSLWANSAKFLLLILLAVFTATFAGCVSRETPKTAGESNAPRETELPETAAPEEPTAQEETTAPQETDIPEHDNTPAGIDTTQQKEDDYTGAAEEWIQLYIENFGAEKADAIIMDSDAISAFNAATAAKTDTIKEIMDFSAAEKLSAEEITALIAQGKTPTGYYTAEGVQLTEEQRTAIDENRNIENGKKYTVSRGIITSRANVRTVPCSAPLYKTADDTFFDRLQETELVVGTPVWILNESEDGKFVFVQAYFYAGWVEKNTVAATDDDSLWKLFGEPETYSASGFAVMLAPLTELNSEKLDMGVKLPLKDKDGTAAFMPCRNEAGMLEAAEVNIENTDYSVGFKKYTEKNFLVQACKYIGTNYGWGGCDDGVDCSGFSCAVFRTFGIYIPRNSGPQGSSVGEITELEGVGATERAQILANVDCPAILWKPGHIMMWLGVKDGKCMMINASSVGSKTVCTGELNLTYEKFNICLVK